MRNGVGRCSSRLLTCPQRSCRCCRGGSARELHALLGKPLGAAELVFLKLGHSNKPINVLPPSNPEQEGEFVPVSQNCLDLWRRAPPRPSPSSHPSSSCRHVKPLLSLAAWDWDARQQVQRGNPICHEGMPSE